jgi:hypothetical protein
MDTKTLVCSLLPFAFFAQTLQAAELAGRIWYEDSKQPASQLNVAVQCPDGIRHGDKTDRYGFYRCTGIPANKQHCYIYLDDGRHYADPLLFVSGEGSDTRNFSILPNGNKFIVRQY